ncbi:MAG: PEP-CTERM sorting domain-containing protein [Candidatus Acidiferrales bacterium]
MKNWAIWMLVAAVALMVVPAAYADGTTVNAYFVGATGTNDGHYYVGPYVGIVGGQQVTLYCVDFNNDVTKGQTWVANETPMSGDLSNTRYGNAANVAQLTLTDPYYSLYTPTQLYEQAAWLTTQYAQFMSDPNYLSNPTDVNAIIAIQYAIWDLFDPQAPTNGAAAAWILSAEQNYGSINPSGFLILTNTAPVNLSGQVQEFIITTPEPETLPMFAAGLLALGLLMRRKSANAKLQQEAV